MRGMALVLLFVAEMAAWAAIGWAVYLLLGGGIVGLRIAAPVVIVTLIAWGLLASPKSRAPQRVRVLTKIIILGGAVVLLFGAGRPGWAGALAVLIILAHGADWATARAGQQRHSPR